jgi:hypothetical protein
MEINLNPMGAYPQGAIAQSDMVEGRCVLMTTNNWSADFGSRTDVPGVKLPSTDAEGLLARYIVSFTPPDRRIDPGNLYFIPQPSLNFALRGGFDQASNLPMTSTTVRDIWMGEQENVTIPSGMNVLLYGDGAVVTLPSGQYIYNANLHTPGSHLEVLGANAGKLSYSATGTIAEVLEYTSDNHLVVRLLG